MSTVIGSNGLPAGTLPPAALPIVGITPGTESGTPLSPAVLDAAPSGDQQPDASAAPAAEFVGSQPAPGEPLTQTIADVGEVLLPADRLPGPQAFTFEVKRDVGTNTGELVTDAGLRVYDSLLIEGDVGRAITQIGQAALRFGDTRLFSSTFYDAIVSKIREYDESHTEEGRETNYRTQREFERLYSRAVQPLVRHFMDLANDTHPRHPFGLKIVTGPVRDSGVLWDDAQLSFEPYSFGQGTILTFNREVMTATVNGMPVIPTMRIRIPKSIGRVEIHEEKFSIDRWGFTILLFAHDESGPRYTIVISKPMEAHLKGPESSLPGVEGQ